MKRVIIATVLACLPGVTFAQGLERCEIVVADEVVDQDGGTMTVASYRPAGEFLDGVYSPKVPLRLTDGDAPIRGILCIRNDLVPTDRDYKILKTGIPLSLSQDFDSADSDIMTIFFADGGFRYKYTSGYPMSPEFKTTLEGQLTQFSDRDHGLVTATK